MGNLKSILAAFRASQSGALGDGYHPSLPANISSQRLALATYGAASRPTYSVDIGRVRSRGVATSPEAIRRALDAYDLAHLRARSPLGERTLVRGR